MIRLLIKLIFLLIPFQLIIIIFGYQPNLSRNVDTFDYYLLAFFVLLLFFFPVFYFFRRDNIVTLPDSYSKLIVSPTNFSKLTTFVMICIAFIATYLMPDFNFKSLNGSQDIEYIGLLFKFSSTICPAIAFTAMTVRPNSFFSVITLLAAFFVSLQMSILFLTKQPLVPYVLMFIHLFWENTKAVSLKIKLASIFALIGLVYVFWLIYMLRLSSADSFGLLSLLTQLIFRIALIPELAEILALNPKPLFTANMPEFFSYITDNVFGYDSRHVGIAPGYVGFFILNFGYLFGFLFSIFLMFFVSRILILCKNSFYLGRLLYFMISIDLIHFITDGNPSIIFSTSGSKFFYALIFGVVVIFLKEIIYKRHNNFKHT